MVLMDRYEARWGVGDPEVQRRRARILRILRRYRARLRRLSSERFLAIVTCKLTISHGTTEVSLDLSTFT